MLKKLLLVIPLLIIFPGIITVNAQDFWTSLEGPTGGSVIDIASHPNGTLYAARYDGVFYSTNDGMSWTRMPQGNVANVSTVEVTPGGILYVGKYSGGIWWTGNNGASWNFNPIHIAPHSGTWASVVTLGINSSSHIYIQSERSFNGGNTFNEFFSISNQLAWDYEFDGASTIYAATNMGLYRSTNGGGSWSSISSGLPNPTTVTKVRTNSSGHLFAGMSATGIFFSSNSGASWAAINNGLGDLNVTALEIDGTGKIYAGTKNGLYTSTNNGSSWSPASTGIPFAYIQSIHIKADNKVFTGTARSGVYFTSDGGQSWAARNNGIKLHNLTGLAFKGSNEIFLSSFYGLHYSGDNGLNWEDRTGSIPTSSIYTAASDNGGTIYAGTFGHGIFKSSNSGMSWTAVNNGIPSNARIKHISVLPDNSVIVLNEGSSSADTMKIYKSTNGGAQWDQIYVVDDILISPSFGTDTQGGIYLTGMTIFLEGLLVRSTNGGNTFEEIDLGPSVKFDYFATGGTDLYSISYDKIFKSTNRGDNWIQLPAGTWGNNRVGPISISSDGDIFLYALGNVLLSENGGTSWTQVSSGLPFPASLRGFAFDNNSFAYIYSYDEGVFRSNNVTSLQANQNIIPGRYHLAQNYPNPFNPATQIKFDIPQKSNVTLVIYNNIGQEAAKLVSGELNAGSYIYNFDASHLPSGVYFYRLQTGAFSETKRMVLIK